MKELKNTTMLSTPLKIHKKRAKTGIDKNLLSLGGTSTLTAKILIKKG
jgi:hypothetical protein